MKKQIVLFILVLGFFAYTPAQVKGPERIIGTYTGDLKKDVAHGKGKSIGKDTYEGNFKKGLPQGEGIYTFGEDIIIDGVSYSKGDVYEGSFDDGLFDGKGKLTYINKEKGTVEGYWSKGKYLGRTENGYEILKKENVVRVVCINNGSYKNDIVINGLNDIVEVGTANIEFDGENKYFNLPVSKFPFTFNIKGTAPVSGAKVELSIFIERPGIWSITVETN